MRRFKIWWLATFCDYPFYRVIYQDGKRTYPLYYGEASGLKNTFKGRLIIDYEYAKSFLSNIQ